MTSPIVLAQATGPQKTPGNPSKVVPVNKPLGEQAIVIHLDGSTKLDLTSIANENITLIHLGDRLIILFDNHAQVTLENFYGPDGQPAADLSVELGPGRDVTAADFAGLFPVSTDPSVLPAAGDAGAPSSGANFNGYVVDPFALPTPLPLLGPTPFATFFTEPLGVPVLTQGTNAIGLTGAALNGDTFEGGLVPQSSILTVGNSPGAVIDFPHGPPPLNLNSLVNFGPAGPGAVPFGFVSQGAAEAWLASLNLTSQGMTVDHVTIVGNTLTASTDPAQTGQPTNDPNPHDIFSLTVNPDGSFQFTLLGPLDDADPGHLTPGPAVLDQITLDLSGFIQATDAQGHTITLANDLFVGVHDDVPEIITTIPSDSPDGPIANVVGGTVDEDGLVSGTPGDLFGSGNGAGNTTVTGSLTPLVAFGADGPDFDLVNKVYDGFQLVSQGAATTWITGLGLTSHDQAVDFAQVSGNTLTAWTGGGPGDPNAHEVFTLTIAGDGTYTFTLINPLDHPDPGHLTPAPEVADTITLDLSGLVQAIDFDGDAITLSADFAVDVIDDVPVQHINDSESGGAIIVAVDEGGLVSGDPGDLFGSGNDPGFATSGSGTVSGLVNFGADGPDVVNGNIAAYQIAVGTNSVIDFGVTSHGSEVDFVTVTDGPAGPHGTSQTLTAWTDLGPDNGGHEVFTLTINGDGTFTFQLINPIDHPIAGAEDHTVLDLSALLAGVDFDGDALALAAGTFQVDITDDVPVIVSGTESATVDEGGLVSGTPGDLYDTGNDPGAPISTTVSLAGTVSFGADGPANPALQFTGQAAADAWLNALNLTSHGQAVDVTSVSGDTLTAWTGGGPGDPNAHAVFSITLDSTNQTYTFTLINPLDHPNPGPATPGPAVEDSLSIDVSGVIQAVDFDHDPVTLSGVSSVTIIDDIPVAQGNLIQNGDFTSGSFTPAFFGGISTTTDGSGDLHWILAPSAPAGADAAQPGFLELERVNVGYLGSFMPDGHPMVDMDATPGDIQLSQVVHGITNGQTYQIEFWTAQTFPPGTGELEVFWGGTLIGTITPDSATPAPHIFTVTGGADDAGNTLTFAEVGHADNFGSYLGDVLMEAGTPFGIVDEGGLTSGVPGDLFGNGNDPGFATSATGTLAGLVHFGADGPAANAFHFSIADGAALNLGVTSHGQAVDFAAISGNTLTAWTGGGPSDVTAHEVFTLTLDGDGTYTFTLINPLDHAADDGENALILNLTSVVQATDFDGDTIPLASGSFLIDVTDDVPVLVSGGEVSATVDEGGLTSGTPGDLFGSGNDPGFATSATGTLSGLVSFGADGPGANGFHFAIADGSVLSLGVTSHGQAVDFAAISGNTLTAWTGGGPSDVTAHEVFTLTLNGDGSYVFQLINPIDHPAGNGENSVALDLSALVQAVDFDGDAVALSGDFQITIIDDVPVPVSGTTSATIDEGGLASGTPGDLYGLGNDPGFATSATVSLSGAVHFGADGPANPAFQFVNQVTADAWLNGLNLISHGEAVDTAVIVGNVLTAWTGGGSGHEVFSLTLNGDETYTFNLINPLDHPDPGQGTPGPAVEDSLSIDVSGVIQATDFDNDPVALTASSTITIVDDIPVAQGNLIQNGDFTSGSFTPAFFGGISTTTDGSGDLHWILAPSAPAGADAAQPGFLELERVNVGYLGSFMPDGHPMVDMDATPGDIQLSQVVHGITNGQTYQIEFWTAQTFPPGTGELEVFWGGTLIGTITPDSATPAPHIFTVTGGADDAGNTLTFAEVGHADNFGSYLGDVLMEAGTPFGIVDEGGLTSGVPGDLFGNGNDPGFAASATGTLAGLVSFGADGPLLDNALFKAGFQFAVPAGAHDFGVQSHGQEVDFFTLSAPVDGPNGVSQTLTAFTGGSSSGTEAFTLTLNGDGTYAFTLVNPLDHATDDGENALILNLTSLIHAIDFDGDTIPLASGSFQIDIIDDVPVAVSNAVSATVDEGGLASGTAGDLYGVGNDPSFATNATISLSGSVHFGADGPGATPFQFVTQAAANAWLTGLSLTSHDQAVDFASIAGNVLTAWTGGGPSDPNAHAVFSVTLNANETYTFNLINPLDHPDPGHATPGPAAEDMLSVDLSGLITAVDFDGDSVTLSGGAIITVTDDIPVAQGNLIHNGNFADGNFTPAFFGGVSTTTDGSGGLDWILAPSADAGANAAQPGFLQLEKINVGYLGSFMPNGDSMVDMDATPGDIQLSQVVHGITNGQAYQLEFWTAQTFPPGTGELEVFWGGTLIGTITADSATPTPHLFSVIGGPNDAANTLTFEEIGTADTFGTYLSDVALEAGSPFGIVDEGGLTSGTPGDLFGSGNDPGFATSATGTLAGLVGFGADGPQLDHALFKAGFQFTAQTGAHDFGVMSHGQEVNFITVSAPIDGPHGVTQTLTAYTNGSSAGTEVFTLTLAGDGTWAFNLINPIDNPAPLPGAGEDSAIFDFSKLVQAVDFDGDTTHLVSGSFLIDVVDDVPVAHVVSATVAENVSATITLTEHVDFSFGADGPGSVSFDTANAHFTTDPTGGQLVLPTAGQFTINGDAITLNPGADFQALNNGQTAVLDIPYTVTDHDGDTKTGDILLNITGVSQLQSFAVAGHGPPPVAHDDTIIENHDTGSAFLIPVAGLLANDSDPNATVNLIAGASFSDASHQFVSFTSPPAATPASFTYSITDSEGTSGPATATVTHVTDDLQSHFGSGDSFIVDHGNDSLNLNGGNASDVLVAGNLTSTALLSGGNGTDVLFTSSFGSFSLDGGNGDDKLFAIGASADDTLTGGNGNDTFAFLTADSSRHVAITDFVTGNDMIDVSAVGFGGGMFSGEVFNATQFQTAANHDFTSSSERFMFDTSNTTLYYSDNGTSAHAIALAQITNGGVVHAADVHVVA